MPDFLAPSPTPSLISSPNAPVTPGTQQVNMSASPTTYLSKLQLLQGLANESAGYGYGYSSRVPTATRASSSHASSSSNLPPTRHSSTMSPTEIVPVLTPLEDESDNEAIEMQEVVSPTEHPIDLMHRKVTVAGTRAELQPLAAPPSKHATEEKDDESRHNSNQALPPPHSALNQASSLAPALPAPSHMRLLPRSAPSTSESTSTTSSDSHGGNLNEEAPFRPRILVVEDSAPNRKLLVMLLRALKCDVVGVENGLLAVREFAGWANANWVGDNIAGKLDPPCEETDETHPDDGPSPSSANHSSSSHSNASVDSGVISPVELVTGESELKRRSVSPVGSTTDSPTEGTIAPTQSQTRQLNKRQVKCNFDLCLIDGNMPVMSGVDATRNIRALGIKIPMIAVTGNALDEDMQTFLAAGVQKILTKPVHRNTLQTTLKEFLPNFIVPTNAKPKVNNTTNNTNNNK